MGNITFNYVSESQCFNLSFLKLDRSEQGNTVRNNVIISVSGAEGLSSPEMLTPSGVYIRNPTNVVEVSYVQLCHQWCGVVKCLLAAYWYSGTMILC